jgi:hypothetical protein
MRKFRCFKGEDIILKNTYCKIFLILEILIRLLISMENKLIFSIFEIYNNSQIIFIMKIISKTKSFNL